MYTYFVRQQQQKKMELSVAVAVTCSSDQDGPHIPTLIITDTQSLPFHWQI